MKSSTPFTDLKALIVRLALFLLLSVRRYPCLIGHAQTAVVIHLAVRVVLHGPNRMQHAVCSVQRHLVHALYDQAVQAAQQQEPAGITHLQGVTIPDIGQVQ